MKRVFALLLVLIIGLSVMSCENSKSVPKTESSLGIGAEAANFVLKDIKGNDVILAKYRGKVVLLEFWATWCPPCKDSIPELVKLSEKYKDRDFVVLGISVEEGTDTALKLADFSREFNINYTVLIGNDNVVKAYNVRSIPLTYLIDKQGKIIHAHMGYIENLGDYLSNKIDQLV